MNVWMFLSSMMSTWHSSKVSYVEWKSPSPSGKMLAAFALVVLIRLIELLRCVVVLGTLGCGGMVIDEIDDEKR